MILIYLILVNTIFSRHTCIFPHDRRLKCICVGCSRTFYGMDYNGVKSVTNTGRTCQRWDAQSPHAHTIPPPYSFPDGNATAAENFCRNNGDWTNPWCYTMDSGMRSEECAVEWCGEMLKFYNFKCFLWSCP